MHYAVEELGPTVTKRLSLWDRGMLTRLEALNGLLEEFVFTLHLHTESHRAIVAVVDLLPTPIAAELAEFMVDQRDRRGWEWPPSGTLDSTYRPAEPVEVAIYVTLLCWLRTRASGISTRLA